MNTLKWADYDGSDSEESVLPHGISASRYETPIDSTGHKTVTSYDKNAKGDDVKIIKRIKVIKHEERINRAIKQRSNLARFGFDEESNETKSNVDEIYMELPKRLNKLLQGDEDDSEYLQDPQFVREKRDLKAKLKKFKDELELTENSQKDTERRMDKPSDRPDRSTSNMKQEECTVRVSNISDYTTEDDLKDLFSKIGTVQRVYLARDREYKNSKGFAFIVYHNHNDAARAIAQLNRHGYDNLLMTVEWAKPNNREK